MVSRSPSRAQRRTIAGAVVAVRSWRRAFSRPAVCSSAPAARAGGWRRRGALTRELSRVAVAQALQRSPYAPRTAALVQADRPVRANPPSARSTDSSLVAGCRQSARAGSASRMRRPALRRVEESAGSRLAAQHSNHWCSRTSCGYGTSTGCGARHSAAVTAARHGDHHRAHTRQARPIPQEQARARRGCIDAMRPSALRRSPTAGRSNQTRNIKALQDRNKHQGVPASTRGSAQPSRVAQQQAETVMLSAMSGRCL